MLETSKDLLLIVIAFCLLWFTVFVCWAMYYLVVMLKDFARMTSSVREKLELVDNILKLVKQKLEKGSDHMAVIADSAIKLVGFIMAQQKKTSEKKKKKE
jgi:ABC-type polysaccharide transport system permease subunit